MALHCKTCWRAPRGEDHVTEMEWGSPTAVPSASSSPSEPPHFLKEGSQGKERHRDRKRSWFEPRARPLSGETLNEILKVSKLQFSHRVVTVHFQGRLDQAAECLGIWANIILDVPVRAFVGQVNTSESTD